MSTTPAPPGASVFESLFGLERGTQIRMGLTMLAAAGLQPADIDEALNKIDRCTSIGPLLDPSAFVDGARFRNAAEYADMLRALRHVVRVLAHCNLRTRDLTS